MGGITNELSAFLRPLQNNLLPTALTLRRWRQSDPPSSTKTQAPENQKSGPKKGPFSGTPPRNSFCKDPIRARFRAQKMGLISGPENPKCMCRCLKNRTSPHHSESTHDTFAKSVSIAISPYTVHMKSKARKDRCEPQGETSIEDRYSRPRK